MNSAPTAGSQEDVVDGVPDFELMAGVDGSRWAPARAGRLAAGGSRPLGSRAGSVVPATQATAGPSSFATAAATASSAAGGSTMRLSRLAMGVNVNGGNVFAIPGVASASNPGARPGTLPPNDETPTRPRVRNHVVRRR